MAGDLLNLHAIAPRSRANGPGVRFVVWFQGCSLRCPGCFNPATHSFEENLLVAVDELARRIREAEPQIEGLTVSGGEPFEQPDGLLRLLRGVRAATRLSVLLFSGFTKERIADTPLGAEILGNADVLVAGPYDQRLRIGRGLRGSANQAVHLLTDRYTLADIQAVPAAEIVISPDGQAIATGINPPAAP